MKTIDDIYWAVLIFSVVAETLLVLVASMVLRININTARATTELVRLNAAFDRAWKVTPQGSKGDAF